MLDVRTEKNDYDAIIVGAGPSGSSAAIYLSQKGFKVLLVDKEKFPREKVCGDCITPPGVELLEEIGILPEIEDKYNRVIGVRIFAEKGVINKTHFKEAGTRDALTVQRKKLDFELVKAAERSGAEIAEGAKTTDVVFDDGKAVGVKFISGGSEIRVSGKYILIATGGGSKLLRDVFNITAQDYRALGVAIRGYYEVEKEVEPYMDLLAQPEHWPALGWIFPIDKDLVNAGIGFYVSDKAKLSKTLSTVMDVFIKDGWYSKTILKKEKLNGQLRSLKLCMGGIKKSITPAGVFLLGEAAGLVNPFTGEGIAHALLSGKLAAKSIEEAESKNGDLKLALTLYEEQVNKELVSYFKNAIFLRRIARSWFITKNLVKVLNLFPALSAYNIRYWVKG